MAEAQLPGMKEHPRQTLLRERLVPGEVAVLVVAGEREAEVRQVDADLVRAAGAELGLEQRQRRLVVAEDPLPVERGHGLAAHRVVDAHPALALAGRELVQGESHDALLVPPAAAHEHEVALVDLPLAQRGVQRGQRRTGLGDQQQPRGVAVQAVDELQEAGGGTRGPQAFDQAVGDAAAAVHREARRLVHRQHRLVLEHDRQRLCRAGRRRRTTLGRRGPDGRDAHRVSQDEACVGADAPAVHPDFPGAQDAVQVALRHTLEDAGEEVVDALAGRRVADFDLPYAFLA